MINIIILTVGLIILAAMALLLPRLINPLYLMALYPSLYFAMDVIEVPGFNTIEQFIAVFALFIIVINKGMETKLDNWRGIYELKVLLLLYLIYSAFCILSLSNYDFKGLADFYHSFTLLGKVIIAVATYQCIKTEKDLNIIILGIIIFLIVTILLFLRASQDYGSLFFLRIPDIILAGSFWSKFIIRNPNLMTRATLILMPIVLIYSFYIKGIRAILLQFLCFFTCLVPYFTLSRATAIATTFAVTAILWRMKRKVYAVILIAFVTILTALNPLMQERVTEVLEKGVSTGRRDQTAAASLRGFLQNPLLGSGKRTIVEVMDKYKGPTSLIKGRRFVQSEHNQYLSLLVESGLVGLSLFLIIIIYYIRFVKSFISKMKEDKLVSLLFGSFVGFIGFMITTMSGGTIDENIFWYNMGITLAIIKLISIRQQQEKYALSHTYAGPPQQFRPIITR